MWFYNFPSSNHQQAEALLFFITSEQTMQLIQKIFVALNSNETPFFRTKFRLRALPVSLRHLGRAGGRRDASGHFQRGLPAVIAQSGSLLSLPPSACESSEVQAVVRKPPHFAQGCGHRGDARAA